MAVSLKTRCYSGGTSFDDITTGIPAESSGLKVSVVEFENALVVMENMVPGWSGWR